MLLIDDAGWGCIVGGVVIGIYNDVSGNFFSREIPPASFQGKAWESKQFLHDAANVVINYLSTNSYPKDAPIMICTGYCLDGISDALSENKYTFCRGKITGPLQFHIESELVSGLARKYAFEVSYDLAVAAANKGLFWWKQIQWLKRGDPERTLRAAPERVPLCKTGWATFDVWANNRYSSAKIMAKELKNEIKAQKRFYRYA